MNATGELAERLSAIVVDAAYHIHVELGPGLLESVYEAVLARALEQRGLRVRRQAPVEFEFDGMHFEDGFRIDLLVEDALILELKSVEKLAPVHAKQLLTYLRLCNLPLGLLINFGAATFKEGCHRVVNNHDRVAASRLRIHQPGVTRSREGREEAGPTG
jgi:iron complex transport system substrate-binding protein